MKTIHTEPRLHGECGPRHGGLAKNRLALLYAPISIAKEPARGCFLQTPVHSCTTVQLDYPLICLKIYLCSFSPCNSFAQCHNLSLLYVDLSDNKLAESPSTCLAVTLTEQGVPAQGPEIERLWTYYDTEPDRSTFTSTQPMVKYSLYIDSHSE